MRWPCWYHSSFRSIYLFISCSNCFNCVVGGVCGQAISRVGYIFPDVYFCCKMEVNSTTKGVFIHSCIFCILASIIVSPWVSLHIAWQIWICSVKLSDVLMHLGHPWAHTGSGEQDSAVHHWRLRVRTEDDVVDSDESSPHMRWPPQFLGLRCSGFVFLVYSIILIFIMLISCHQRIDCAVRDQGHLWHSPRSKGNRSWKSWRKSFESFSNARTNRIVFGNDRC